MGNVSNRTLVTAAVVVIASTAAMTFIMPWPLWRGISRYPIPAPAHVGRLADDYQVEIMAPEVLPSQATTTVSFRIVNHGQLVTSFGRPIEYAVQVAVSRRGSNELQVLTPTFSTTTGTFSAAVSFVRAGIYRFMVDFLPKSDTPIRRYGDVDVGD